MRKTNRKLLAALLSVILLVSALPFIVSASEDDLRDTVVNHTESIMNVLWTKQKRNARASADADAMRAAGVRPTIYYESDDLLIPFKGVAVSQKSGSLEAFESEIKASGSEMITGVPNLILSDYNDYVGMDANSFLLDVVSRVSADAPTSVKQAASHKSMVSLGGTVNASAADSKSAADAAAVKAGYAKLKKGDILLAWNDNCDWGIASNTDAQDQLGYPRVSALIVKSVSGGNVTVMYPGYHQPEWHFVCSKCGKESTELTYRYPRAHSFYNNYDTWKGFTTHNKTYTDSTCDGTWVGQYATTWRTETVTYDQLLGGTHGSNVPYGSDSTYLPFTLAVYSSAAPKAEVKVTSSATAESITGGFTAKITSNYRIASVEAVLTSDTGAVQRFASALADWKAWNTTYSDPALDLALMESKSGKYSLDLYVRAGAEDPVKAYSMDFALTDASFRFATDKKAVTQGETVTATITAQRGGVAVVKTAVAYDPKWFDFDAAKSKAASPNTTFTVNEDKNAAIPTAQIDVRYDGNAVASGATPVTLYFTAKRTGLYPVLEGITPFKMLFLQTSTTKGTADAQLTADRGDGSGTITIGYNTVLYKNYAAGNDLLLVFVSNDYEDLVKKTTLPMMYDGVLMEEVTQARYTVGGSRYLVCFGHIGPNLDPLKVSKNEASDAKMSPEIEYNEFNAHFYDINGSGVADVADAQTIVNIINGNLPLEGNVTKWLRADVNRDGKLDLKDRDALLNALMN